jgi:prephenate dehydratase
MEKETLAKQEPKRVAIQGIKGAFHEIAARNFFKDDDISVVQCNTFEEVTQCLEEDMADYAVMAIENTVAGSLITNYTLLRECAVKIVGEEYLRIKQNLMALPGQKIEDIKEVHSHYMAINQCRNYFKQFPWIKLVESVDTALSAKEIRQWNISGRGAIAGDLAALLFNLQIMAESIETNKRNYTRFLILTREDRQKEDKEPVTKASLCFSLPHQKGSLAKVLTILADYGMNLTKVQSMPIIGQEFRYFFYIDVAFSYYHSYKSALEELAPYVVDMHILGEYVHALESLESIHN